MVKLKKIPTSSLRQDNDRNFLIIFPILKSSLIAILSFSE